MRFDEGSIPPDVMRFIDDRIESIPHLEAALLLWESSHLRWDVERVAARLYVATDRAAAVLEDLAARRVVVRYLDEDHLYYRYDDDWDDEQSGTMARVAATYRHHLLQVTALIHSKASTAVRDFARAFQIPLKKKE